MFCDRENCGAGANGTQHDAHGLPTINGTRFPSMKNMVDYGHGKNLKVGWYQNGCMCPEKQDMPLNYAGDIKLLYDYGFDGCVLYKPSKYGVIGTCIMYSVKMDDCGAQRNMTLYASLMQAQGRSVSIENHKKPEHADCGQFDNSSCPSLVGKIFSLPRLSPFISCFLPLTRLGARTTGTGVVTISTIHPSRGSVTFKP